MYDKSQNVVFTLVISQLVFFLVYHCSVFVKDPFSFSSRNTSRFSSSIHWSYKRPVRRSGRRTKV